MRGGSESRKGEKVRGVREDIEKRENEKIREEKRREESGKEKGRENSVDEKE